MKQDTAGKGGVPGREMIPGGWEGLAMAVIYQACEDYRACRRACRRHPDSRKADAALRRTERFFTSRWFRALSNLDGASLLKQLKEETR